MPLFPATGRPEQPWSPGERAEVGEEDGEGAGEPASLDPAELLGLARATAAKARALAERGEEADGGFVEGVPLVLLGHELAELGRELLGDEGREMILSLARRDGLLP